MKNLVLLLGILGFCYPALANDAPSPFSLDAQILWAVEGGPLVIRSKLTYHGSAPILIHWFNRSDQASVDTAGILKRKPLRFRLGSV
jgi:hypothetical protein